MNFSKTSIAVGGAAIVLCTGVVAQMRFPQHFPSQQAVTSCGVFKSVEQLRDNRVTFRICAPKANEVQVVEDSHSVESMTKDANGLFRGTTAKQLKPNYYRYFFIVDGVRTVDPLGHDFSENLEGVMGLFEVTGPELNFAAFHKDIPHGSVAEMKYWSNSLAAMRRLQVYIPPGYTKGEGTYPVLYLLHGTGDNDDSWGSIGRANVILDNLIATGQAVRMIVVMPAGHVPPRGPNASAPVTGLSDLNDDFGRDLLHDIMPLIESSYRTINDPDHRAIAGLSMGGSQAILSGLLHPELFHYVGIFSASIHDPDGYKSLDEDTDGSALDRAAPQMKLVYYALGKTDPLFKDPNVLMDVLSRHGIKVVLNYSNGGHEWLNWRRYLHDFAQLLFR